MGPILGGITGAIAYEFVFNPRRRTFASYTNAYAGRPAAYINSHILPGAYMGHMQQVSWIISIEGGAVQICNSGWEVQAWPTKRYIHVMHSMADLRFIQCHVNHMTLEAPYFL